MIDNLLLGIGAMKAGTTWLYAHLDKHPDIFFAREKEIHYFSHANKKYNLSNTLRIRNLCNAMDRLKGTNNLAQARRILAWYYGYINPGINESWYFNLFRDHGNEKYFADFSNTYAFIDEEGWEAVRRTCENVKVLYTLRDPAKRLWSHIKFHAKFTGKEIDFEEWSSKDYSAFLDSNQHILTPGEYSNTIQVIRRALLSNEYLVLYLDNFETDPLASIRNIESFLDIRPFAYDEDKLKAKINTTESAGIPQPLLAVAADRINDEINKLTELGVHVPDSWHQSLSTK